MFLEMQVSLAPTLVHPSVTLSEFHSVSVSHGGAHDGRHGGRKKEKNMADMELDMVADKKTIENTRLVCLLLLCELNFLLLIN